MAKSNFIVRGGADFSGITKALQKTQKQVTGFQTNLNKNMAGVGKAFKLALGAVTIGQLIKSSAQLIKSSTQMAISVESSMDNIRRNMGKAAEGYTEFVRAQSKSLGVARKDAYAYGSTFSNLLGSFLADTQQVSSETQNLAKSAAVIASKTGRTYKDVAERIRSGMLGSTEAIEDLGIYTNISMIEATDAFKKFANGKSWSQLDFKVQQQIRLAAILEQTYDRYGDTLADTTQTKQAMFLASLENIKLNLGQAFLPIYNVVLPALTALANKLEQITANLAVFTESIFGKTKSIQAIEDQTTAIADQGNAIEAVGKQAKRSLAGFDELNVLSTTEAGGGGSGSAPDTSAINAMAEDTDEAEGKVTKAIDKMKAKLEEMVGLFKTGFTIGFGESNFDSIATGIENIKKSLNGIFTSPEATNMADNWANRVTLSAGKVTGSLANIGTTVAELFTGSFDKYLSQNTEFLRGKIASLFNISGKRAEIWGNISTAIADIFSVFRSDEAKQIGADLIGIFANSGLSILQLGWQYGNDFLEFISAPIVNNKDKIKTAIENTLKPVSTVVNAVKNTIDAAFTAIWDSYTTYVQPAWENMKQYMTTVWGGLLDGYNKYLAPTLDKIATKFSQLMQNNITPLFAKASDLIGSLIFELSRFWNFISPFVSWLLQNVIAVISVKLELLWNIVELVFKQITTTVNSFIGTARGLLDFIVGIFTGDWDRAWSGIKQIFITQVEMIKSTILNVTDYFKNQFKTAFEAVEKLTGVKFNSIKSGFVSGWNRVKETLSSVPSYFKEKFDAGYKAVKDAFSPFVNFFDGLGNSIKNTFKGALNGVINQFNKFINWVNSKLKFSWDGLKIAGNTIFEGGTVQLAKIPAIPQLAQGGIVDSPTLAMIGEAGKEAVVPLENTSFVTTIASAIANEIGKVISAAGSNNNNGDVVVKVGEDDFARIAIKAITNANRRAGGILLEGVL